MRPRVRVHVRTRGLAWVRWPPGWGGVRRLRGKHTSESCVRRARELPRALLGVHVHMWG